MVSHLWSRISTKSTRVLRSHKWIFVSPFVQTVVSDNSSFLYGLVVLSQFWFLHQSHVRSNCQNHLVTISALHFRRLWFCSTGTVSITSTLLSPPALPSFCSVQIRSMMNPVFLTTPVFEMPTLLKVNVWLWRQHLLGVMQIPVVVFHVRYLLILVSLLKLSQSIAHCIILCVSCILYTVS